MPPCGRDINLKKTNKQENKNATEAELPHLSFISEILF